jgi:hypothetical protein
MYYVGMHRCVLISVIMNKHYQTVVYMAMITLEHLPHETTHTHTHTATAS